MPYGEEQEDFYDEQSTFSYTDDSFKGIYLHLCYPAEIYYKLLSFFPTIICYYRLCYMK